MTTLTEKEIAMQNDTDVLSHIREENAQRKARAKAEGWQCCFTTSEGIADRFENVYEYEFEMALQSYSDCYKSDKGFRPTLKRDEWTLSDVEEMLRNM